MKSILGKKKGKSIIHFDKENNCSFFSDRCHLLKKYI